MSTSITTMTPSSSSADCFYFYNSKCLMGSLCPYRHEPAALRSETVCHYWVMGNCRKPNCSFRHTNIIKSRNSTPCFYENRPGGCKKVNCPFLHVTVRDQSKEDDKQKSSILILPTAKGAPQLLHSGSRRAAGYRWHTPRFNIKRVVITASDLESDSDNDSDYYSYSSSSCSSTNVTSDSSDSFIQHSAEKLKELEQLRNMQLEQASLMGYIFEDDNNDPRFTSERQGYHLQESSIVTAKLADKPQQSRVVGRHSIPVPRRSTPEPLQHILEPKNKENVHPSQIKREGSPLSGPPTKKRRSSRKPVLTQACRTVTMNDTNIQCTVSFATPVTRRVGGPVLSECSKDCSTSESDSRNILADLLQFEIPEEYRG